MKNKIYKLLSIIVAFAVALSCCVIGLTTSANEAKATYYLSANSTATERDGTTNAPFKTLEEALKYAVEKADAGAYNSPENTVDFKLLDTYSTDSDIVYWGDGLKNISWKFTLNVSSNTSGAAIGQNPYVEHTYFNGPIVFENININVASSNYPYSVYLCGSNVTIASDVDIWGAKYAPLYTATYGYVNGKIPVYTEAQTFNFNYSGTNVWPRFVIGGRVEATYDNDFILNYNNPNTAQTISLGGTFAADYIATFNKNLNLNFAASKGIALNKTVGGVKFGANAAVQIINSTGNTVDYTALEADFATVPTFVLTNNTGNKDLITFTDKAGEFAVDTSKYNVTATSADGKTYTAEDNILKVPAGEYELSCSAPEKSNVYYVDGASGKDTNAGTKNAPFESIVGALTKAVADAKEGNYNYPNSTVYFKILGSSAIDCANIGNVDYDFKLDISSADESGNGVLNIGSNKKAIFNGPTELSNLTINVGHWGEVYFNGVDFTLGNNVTINYSNVQAFFATNYNVTNMLETQNIVYNNEGTVGIDYFAIGGGGSTVYNADINLIYNAPNNSQKILLDSVNAGQKGTYNKNLNLDFRASKGITLSKRNAVEFGPEAAVQIINSTGNAVNTADIKLPSKTYIFTNPSGVKNALFFTDKAGEYIVNENYEVTVTASDGTVCDIQNGRLTVEPGNYTMDVKVEPKDVCYYVSANAGSNRDGSAEAPFKTIGEALKKAIANADEGCYNFADSTVNLKLLDTTPVAYSDASGISYNFKLKISSDISGAVLDNGATVEMNFCGAVTLENVNLQLQKEDLIYLNANDFIVGDNANVVVPDMDSGKAQTYFVLGAGSAEINANKAVNISYKDNSKRDITFFSLGGGKTTYYNSDLNVKLSLGHYQKIRFGTVSSGTAYYNKNVNLDFQQANNIDLVSGNVRYAFGSNAALQILNSTGSAINFEEALKTSLANVPTYVIKNNTGIKDIITFTEKAGEYTVDTDKYQLTAVAQDGTKYPAKNGQLSIPAGEYELLVKSSDGSIDYLNRMVYFYTSGGIHSLSSQAYITAGKTYCYEFNIYSNNFDDLTLFADISGTTANFTNITKQKTDNYYTVKAEIAIPSECTKTNGLIGIKMPAYTEGVIFDRAFYEKGDTAKTNMIVENQKFYSGLDGVKLDSAFWGNIYTGDRGGKGVTYWTNGVEVLKADYLDTGFIKELVSLANPADSQWSNKASDDINGIKGFNICDLVYAAKLVGTDFTEADFNSVAEKNDDNVINGADISIIRTELLTGVEYQTEEAFAYKGYAETQRNALHTKIMSAPNTLEKYSVSGTVYYVSNNGKSTNSGTSASQPITFDRFKALTLKSGDAVLFERGSVFRLTESINCVGGVTYGAYGTTGDKPMILGSECDFADGTWTASAKENVWKINYPSNNDIAGGFFNGGKEIGVMKSSVRVLYKNMDFYYDKENAVIYLYSDKGKPSLVWDNIEFSQVNVHFDIAAHISNITIDNLALKYMGSFGVSADFNNHYITVTNCEIGFIGGVMNGDGVRYGNGIQAWCGGHDMKWDNNWIYHVFDSAVTLQGTAGNIDWSDYYNVSMSNNLFEYNNADIEIWEAGASPAEFYNWSMNNNIHRFTSLGWGTRLEEGIRGIQGVHVGQVRDHNTRNFTWNNNIIDCPSDYIFNKYCHLESEYNAFERSGNTYYIKQDLRRHTVLTFQFYWEDGARKDNVAANKEETLAEFAKFEPSATVHWYE
ncbi:MAG: hypothetical protein IKK55_01810 [Clostridia bacterium]|nr:hypothetical protein [Clostridia bacterium]